MLLQSLGGFPLLEHHHLILVWLHLRRDHGLDVDKRHILNTSLLLKHLRHHFSEVF